MTFTQQARVCGKAKRIMAFVSDAERWSKSVSKVTISFYDDRIPLEIDVLSILYTYQ
jgi:hypothetical protein